MLRIHLTADDLARVRVSVLGALAEAQLSLRVLKRQDNAALFGGWRETARKGLPSSTAPLARFLAHPTMGLVDLFTLAGGPLRDPEEMEDRVSGMPLEPLRLEVESFPRLAARRPAWLGRLGHDAEDSARLGSALRAWYDHGLGPHWDRIRNHLEGERTAYARFVVDGGVQALLGSLRPAVRWSPPVLEIPAYRPYGPYSEIHLGGRGLTIAPSFFACAAAALYMPMDDPDGPMLLMVPALRDPVAAAGVWADRSRTDPLATLLGRTRAAVLESIGDGCTTGSLAVRLRISPAGASQHATVLRQAGLIGSRRDGGRVFHHLTELGIALLSGR